MKKRRPKKDFTVVNHLTGSANGFAQPFKMFNECRRKDENDEKKNDQFVDRTLDVPIDDGHAAHPVSAYTPRCVQFIPPKPEHRAVLFPQSTRVKHPLP